MLLSIWWVFAITLSVFPGTFNKGKFNFMDKIKDPETRKAWYNTIILLMFNIVDTLGRKIGGMYSLPDKVIPIFAIIRIIFFPTSFFIGLYNTKSKSNEGP